MKGFDKIAAAALTALTGAHTAEAQEVQHDAPIARVSAPSETKGIEGIDLTDTHNPVLITREQMSLRDDSVSALPLREVEEVNQDGAFGIDGDGVSMRTGNGGRVEMEGDAGEVRLGYRQEF